MLKPYLKEVIERIERVSVQVQERFGDLNAAQLNWKSEPKRWSIGQCLDHLIATNRYYFPILEESVGGDRPKKFFQRMPFWGRMWGQVMLRSIQRRPRQKISAPADFQPHQGELPADMVHQFLRHNRELIEKLKRTNPAHHRDIYVTAPSARIITFSLHDLLHIIANHEERHLWQATRVLEQDAFPRRAQDRS